MNVEDLRQYLLKVAKTGYADPSGESKWIKEKDGSTTIKHEDGAWSMHDNFFGGEPYGGREVIMFEGKPVWIMVYYGEVSKDVSDVKGVYAALQAALSNPDQQTPLRGPKDFVSGDFKYETQIDGDILRFQGNERILNGKIEVYNARYMGGLVDQRAE